MLAKPPPRWFTGANTVCIIYRGRGACSRDYGIYLFFSNSQIRAFLSCDPRFEWSHLDSQPPSTCHTCKQNIRLHTRNVQLIYSIAQTVVKMIHSIAHDKCAVDIFNCTNCCANDTFYCTKIYVQLIHVHTKHSITHNCVNDISNIRLQRKSFCVIDIPVCT